MASSSENMASIGTWPFYPGFSDSWLSDAFSRDTEALTRALQHSISNSNLLVVPTFTASSISGGSDPESTTTLKRHRTVDDNNNNNYTVPPTGKVSKPKRKSRASSSKRSQTTFIKADPANFRQMVQQVTGFSFGKEQMSPAPMIMKPVPEIHACLPTLDTSAFLLDQQHPSAVVLFDGVASDGAASLDCDKLPCFPTLESSKA